MGECVFILELMTKIMIIVIMIMVLMMFTVCWNLIGHCQGRTRLTVLVKGVLRKAVGNETDRQSDERMEKINRCFSDLLF